MARLIVPLTAAVLLLAILLARSFRRWRTERSRDRAPVSEQWRREHGGGAR